MTRPVPFGPGNFCHAAVHDAIVDGINCGKVTIAALVGATPGENPGSIAAMTIDIATGRFNGWRIGGSRCCERVGKANKCLGPIGRNVIIFINMISDVGNVVAAATNGISMAPVTGETPGDGMLCMAVSLSLIAISIIRPGRIAGMTAAAGYVRLDRIPFDP